MCTVCGCSGPVLVDGKFMTHDEAHRLGLAHSHAPAPGAANHAHSHGGGPLGHGHAAADLHFGLGAAGVSVPGLSQSRLIEVETAILSKNDALAAGNRRVLAAFGVLALNLVSSPGSGKTTLLCRTISALGEAPLR